MRRSPPHPRLTHALLGFVCLLAVSCRASAEGPADEFGAVGDFSLTERDGRTVRRGGVAVIRCQEPDCLPLVVRNPCAGAALHG